MFIMAEILTTIEFISIFIFLIGVLLYIGKWIKSPSKHITVPSNTTEYHIPPDVPVNGYQKIYSCPDCRNINTGDDGAYLWSSCPFCGFTDLIKITARWDGKKWVRKFD